MTREEERDAISAEVGRMTTTFARLELALHHLLWEMLGGESEAVRVVTGRLGFRDLLNLMTALVKAGVPENEDRREKVRKLLTPLTRIGDRRNSVVHGVVMDFGDELTLTRVRDAVWDDHAQRVSVSEVEKVRRRSHTLMERVQAVNVEMLRDALEQSGLNV